MTARASRSSSGRPIGKLVSPAWRDKQKHDEATVAGLSLIVSEAAGKCNLAIGPGDGTTELDVGLPCCFQCLDGDVLVRTFPAFSIKTVFAVIGTPIDEETRKSYWLDAGTVCAAKAQGIVVDRGKIEVAGPPVEGGVWCRDKGVDRRGFYGFAETYRRKR